MKQFGAAAIGVQYAIGAMCIMTGLLKWKAYPIVIGILLVVLTAVLMNLTKEKP